MPTASTARANSSGRSGVACAAGDGGTGEKLFLILRADGTSGKLEKGTFMPAWLTPQRANGLSIRNATGEGARQFVVGDSASGFRSKEPWYEAPEGGYKGGGFLAVFDPEFKMTQAGYFPGASIGCVASRGGTVVIAGSAKDKNTVSDKSIPDAPEITYPVPAFKPLQPAFPGGGKDAYFAIFRAAK